MENRNNDIVMIDPNMDLSQRSPLEGLEEDTLKLSEEDIVDMVSEAVKRIINKK